MKKSPNVAILMLAMSTLISSVPASAADGTDFTAAQQARIGEIAADYLVAHPDVLGSVWISKIIVR